MTQMRDVMGNNLADIATQQRAVRLIVFSLAVFLLFVCSCLISAAMTGTLRGVEPQRRPQRRVSKKSQNTALQKSRIDYSNFSHRTHIE
jgi:hypothetical protein